MARRKLVGPFDNHGVAALCFDGGAGKAVVEAPHARWGQIAMDSLLDLAHGYAVVRNLHAGVFGIGTGSERLRDGWDGQRVNKWRERGWVKRAAGRSWRADARAGCGQASGFQKIPAGQIVHS